MTTADAGPSASRPSTPVPVLAGIGGVFALFYAYAIWQAIGNLAGSVQAAAAVDVSLNALGWFIWIFAIVFPGIVFAAAFALSWRRGSATYALVLLAGLGLVGVSWLNVVAYTSLNTAAVIG
jgi:hypothetical protein